MHSGIIHRGTHALRALAWLLLLTCPVFAADYYVTQSGAGDGSGSSEANAKAIASYSSSLAAPGDTVHFCGSFTSTIAAVESGSDGSLYRMTGAGCTSAGTLDFGIESIGTSGDWSDQGSNVWRKTVTRTSVDQVWFNDKLGILDATPDAIGEWTWASNNLDVYATSNPASYYTSIVVPNDSNGLITNGGASGGGNNSGGGGGANHFSSGAPGGATGVAGTTCDVSTHGYGGGGGGGGVNAAGGNGCQGFIRLTIP